MSNTIEEHDLHELELRLYRAGRQVECDPNHKTRLREELMRHHQELNVEQRTTRRAALKFWPQFPGLKRLTLVVPPALAVAFAFSAVLVGVQFNGHQTTQAAEAARLTKALTRTVPTVTQWQWTIQTARAKGPSAYVTQFPLRTGQALYIRDRTAYFYTGNQWARITPTRSTDINSPYWQWAFTDLLSHLTPHGFTLLHNRTIRGHVAEGLHYAVSHAGNREIDATAWVDRQSALVLRLEMSVKQSGKVIETDSADYVYTRSK